MLRRYNWRSSSLGKNQVLKEQKDRIKQNFKSIGTVSLVLGMILGCSSQVDPEVVQFVNEVKSKKTTFKNTLPEFPRPKSFKYSASPLRDPFQPFSSPKADVAPAPSNQTAGPDQNRAREPLEAYPLDSLQMVGTLERAGEFFALVKDNIGTVHMAKVGEYIGQNSGKIEKINDLMIEVKEWLTNGKGGWREHVATLPMVETQSSPQKQ